MVVINLHGSLNSKALKCESINVGDVTIGEPGFLDLSKQIKEVIGQKELLFSSIDNFGVALNNGNRIPFSIASYFLVAPSNSTISRLVIRVWHY